MGRRRQRRIVAGIMSAAIAAVVVATGTIPASAVAHRWVDTPGITHVYVDSQITYGLALSPSERTAVFTTLDGHVRLLDLPSRTQTASIATSNGLSDPTFSPDGKRVYLRDYWGQQLLVLDVASRSIVARVPLGQSASYLTMSTDGSTLALFGWGKLTLVDTATLTTEERRMPQPSTGLSSVTYSPDLSEIYELTQGDGATRPAAFTALDATTGATLWAVPLTSGDSSIATDTTRGLAYIGTPDGVQVIDLAAGTAAPLGEAPAAGQLALTPDGTRLIVGTAGPALEILDTASGATLAHTDLWQGPGLLTVTKAGDRVFSTAEDPPTRESTTVEIRISDGQILSTVPVGIVATGPAAVTGNGKVLLMPASYELNVVDYPRTAFAPSIARLGSFDRWETASDISTEFGNGVPAVYVASGQQFPDALGAAAVAGMIGAPLMLTPTEWLAGQIPQRLQWDFDRAPVVVVGGNQAVSEPVFKQIRDSSSTVSRVAGADRYATARSLVRSQFAAGSRPATVYIATGAEFPDALSAGAVAASERVPLVLLNGKAEGLDADTRQLLTELGASGYSVVGGTNAVSAGIERELEALAPVQRFSGSDRYDTSAALNEARFPSPHEAFLASGSGFADALAGSAAAGFRHSPLYVTPPGCLPARTAADLSSAKIGVVTLLGGQAVLSDAVGRLTIC